MCNPEEQTNTERKSGMKIEKSAFDAALAKLLKATPLPKSKISPKATKTERPRPPRKAVPGRKPSQ